MGSFILRRVRPSDLQNWIKTNAPASLRGTAADSWMAYLTANGGTGITFHDLETSFLKSLSKTGGTLNDRWGQQLAGMGGISEKARSTYK